MPAMSSARSTQCSAEASLRRSMDLSVVIPCYNEAPHLRASVAALAETLDGTRYDYEIVFVDDCSQDDTRALLVDICREYPRSVQAT